MGPQEGARGETQGKADLRRKARHRREFAPQVRRRRAEERTEVS